MKLIIYAKNADQFVNLDDIKVIKWSKTKEDELDGETEYRVIDVN